MTPPTQERSDKAKPLPTIWSVPDPPAKTGRKRADPRRALDGIIYRMRTG